MGFQTSKNTICCISSLFDLLSVTIVTLSLSYAFIKLLVDCKPAYHTFPYSKISESVVFLFIWLMAL